MRDRQQLTQCLFASGMIGLGILGLSVGDFALQWQPVPAGIPGRTVLAYLSAVFMLAAGIGLLYRPTVRLSVRLLLPYLILWLLLKIPGVLAAPGVEATWLGLGEIAALLAGGWILFARHADLPAGSALAFATGARGTRRARMLFGLALLPVGLSHLVYPAETRAFVPAWLPARGGWAMLTGVGQMAAGLGVLFSVLPLAAAVAEGAMLTIFTLLVWVPAIAAAPAARVPWTAALISWAIAGAAWVVAGSLTGERRKGG
jgi:uncharacterized membrane protein